jgi:heat shock protein HslJ
VDVVLQVENDGRFHGNAGCNNYFGSYGPSSEVRSSTNSETSFTIAGPLGSTMMMCDKSLMVQESACMENFKGTIKFSVSQDKSLLDLKDAETDTVVAEYTLFAPLILDQTWTATKYYNSTEKGLVDVIPGSSITLKMEMDETSLGGTAGCNTYTGLPLMT